MDANPTAQNGQPCTTQTGGELLAEMQGVYARAGECLINYDGSLDGAAPGDATPEEAIRTAGFGRFPLTRYDAAGATDALVYFYETEGNRRVGMYRVQVMADRSFIVHGLVASTPMK